jgi:hypothetical protein
MPAGSQCIHFFVDEAANFLQRKCIGNAAQYRRARLVAQTHMAPS